MSNYVLITFAKNEEKFLPKIINSLLEYDLHPILWIFINDYSTDNTLNLLEEYVNKYSFIKVINTDDKNKITLVDGRFGYLANIGFNYAINYCLNNKINWDYIGFLDADTQISKNYFRRLINNLDLNQDLGIVSGTLYSMNSKNRYKKESSYSHLASGSGRLIRKKCLFNIKGYDVTLSADTVSLVRAIINGWKTRRYTDIIAFQLRETSSKEGLVKGYYWVGINRYFYNYHPLIILFNIIKLFFSSHFVYIPDFLRGYYSGLLHKYRIKDVIISQYFYSYRLREILHIIFHGDNP